MSNTRVSLLGIDVNSMRASAGNDIDVSASGRSRVSVKITNSATSSPVRFVRPPSSFQTHSGLYSARRSARTPNTKAAPVPSSEMPQAIQPHHSMTMPFSVPSTKKAAA
ncbi:MAG: hypothetical protein QM630_01125 [Microbacterium sp.]